MKEVEDDGTMAERIKAAIIEECREADRLATIREVREAEIEAYFGAPTPRPVQVKEEDEAKTGQVLLEDVKVVVSEVA